VYVIVSYLPPPDRNASTEDVASPHRPMEGVCWRLAEAARARAVEHHPFAAKAKTRPLGVACYRHHAHRRDLGSLYGVSGEHL